MATTKIYHQEENRFYQVTADVFSSVLDDGSGEVDYYLKISTSIRKTDGSSFPDFRVKTLNDVPPGGSAPATDFSDLVDQYLNYFMTQAELGQSSSSSSNSSSSSSYEYSSSSSSSSNGYSESSSSSS